MSDLYFNNKDFRLLCDKSMDHDVHLYTEEEIVKSYLSKNGYAELIFHKPTELPEKKGVSFSDDILIYPEDGYGAPFVGCYSYLLGEYRHPNKIYGYQPWQIKCWAYIPRKDEV